MIDESAFTALTDRVLGAIGTALDAVGAATSTGRITTAC